MQLQFEKHDKHSIQSYNDTQVTVNQIHYQRSVIISQHDIISDWTLHKGQHFQVIHLEPLLNLTPELILIGTTTPMQLPQDVLSVLWEKHIGVECMPLGAACRTFNVLLHEERKALLAVIF